MDTSKCIPPVFHVCKTLRATIYCTARDSCWRTCGWRRVSGGRRWRKRAQMRTVVTAMSVVPANLKRLKWISVRVGQVSAHGGAVSTCERTREGRR